MRQLTDGCEEIERPKKVGWLGLFCGRSQPLNPTGRIRKATIGWQVSRDVGERDAIGCDDNHANVTEIPGAPFGVAGLYDIAECSKMILMVEKSRD